MGAFARFIERISLRFLRRGAEALGHAASSAAQAGKHFAVEQLPRLCYIESEYVPVKQLFASNRLLLQLTCMGCLICLPDEKQQSPGEEMRRNEVSNRSFQEHTRTRRPR